MLSHPFTPSTTGVPLSFDYSIHSLLHSKLNTNFALIFFLGPRAQRRVKTIPAAKELTVQPENSTERREGTGHLRAAGEGA